MNLNIFYVFKDNIDALKLFVNNVEPVVKSEKTEELEDKFIEYVSALLCLSKTDPEHYKIEEEDNSETKELFESFDKVYKKMEQECIKD